MALATGELNLYNSLSGKKEIYRNLKGSKARIYSCGPTVNGRAHLGNFRRYFLDDILIRTLKYNKFPTLYIQNITDVGHLTDDADNGEDKVEFSAKEANKSAIEIADFFTELYIEDSKKLNITEPDDRPRAREHIKEQINFIGELEKKGKTYTIDDGVYFDTSRITDYGKLINLDVEGLKEGARVDKNIQKRNKTDFALWKFSRRDTKRQMEWSSPWGVGFPGWHIECSAMSKKYLDFPFDIHIGGVDNAPTHHVNEIAQNEALFGKSTVNFWLHSEHMLVDNSRMGKSIGNTITIDDLKSHSISPLSFRYYCLGTHYRQKMNFTWDAVISAQNSFARIIHSLFRLPDIEVKVVNNSKWINKFFNEMNNDLNAPKGLAVLHKMLGDDECKAEEKIYNAFEFDKILGLDLINKSKEMRSIPTDILKIRDEREKLRIAKKWDEADKLRDELVSSGYKIEDTKDGPIILNLH